MQAVEIKKDIFWVGAVDYDTRDFHGYAYVPEGTSYNAYLIKDAKNVLFDSVSSSFAGAMLCRLAKALPLEKVDYIVCNHLELDHAGVLAELVVRCKPEKIFCSQMGLKSMQGYFDCKDWPVQAVKNGESLNIGSRTLQFFETRMLHWPDSMASYIPEDKLLISNDAFGQNIASTVRYADEVSEECLRNAVEAYYYNIVLPFSPQVTSALKALGGLDIDLIAPDHGLMFRGTQSVRYILDAYARLAEQKPQKRALVMYDSMWQSTKKMAYSVASGLEDAGVPSRVMSLKSNHHSEVMTELARCGAVLAGSPTHNNGVLPAMAGMLAYMQGLRPKNRVGGAFGSYGWSGESPKILHERLASMDMEMPAPFVKIQWTPRHEGFGQCHALGKAVGQALVVKCGG